MILTLVAGIGTLCVYTRTTVTLTLNLNLNLNLSLNLSQRSMTCRFSAVLVR